MKLTINDAATTSLVDHMSSIDKQRRFIIMQQKEVETKLAFAEEEYKTLTKQREIANDEEVKLRTELEKLLEEQQQLQLRVMADANLVQRAEEEEPLLTKHVEEKLASILAELPQYTQKVEQINELHESYLVSHQRDMLEKKWKECSSMLLELNKEKELLQSELQKEQEKLHNLQEEMHELLSNGEAEKQELQQISSLANKSNACESNHVTKICINNGNNKESAASANNNVNEEYKQFTSMHATLTRQIDDGQRRERERVLVEIQECEYQLEKVNAQNARQLAMIQREVNDLSCRAEELGQWLHDMEITKQQLMLCANNFDRCFNSEVCIFCL